MILTDAVSKLETFVWILNHISRSITWSLFPLKASYLVKWPMWTWSFMWLVKIWNSPQFLFRNGLLHACRETLATLEAMLLDRKLDVFIFGAWKSKIFTKTFLMPERIRGWCIYSVSLKPEWSFSCSGQCAIYMCAMFLASWHRSKGRPLTNSWFVYASNMLAELWEKIFEIK